MITIKNPRVLAKYDEIYKIGQNHFFKKTLEYVKNDHNNYFITILCGSRSPREFANFSTKAYRVDASEIRS